MSERPSGTNADEWNVFLSEHADALPYVAVQIVEALEKVSPPEIFDLGNGFAVNFNPRGRFHGWLFRRHPDGQWVSVKKLEKDEPATGLERKLRNEP
jgi:hypothetical protein